MNRGREAIWDVDFSGKPRARGERLSCNLLARSPPRSQLCTGPQTIPLTQVSYWSGPATATSGSGTFTPGQLAAANAVNLTAGRVAFSLTSGSGVNSASWNPTLSVQVPAGAVAGTYTATITESVA